MFRGNGDQRSRGRVPVKGLTLDRFLKLSRNLPDNTAIKLDLPWDKIYFQHISKISIQHDGLFMDSSSQLQEFLKLVDFRQLGEQCSQKMLRHQRAVMSMMNIDKRTGSIVLG